jgi:hypothetical protein
MTVENILDGRLRIIRYATFVALVVHELIQQVQFEEEQVQHTTPSTTTFARQTANTEFT